MKILFFFFVGLWITTSYAQSNIPQSQPSDLYKQILKADSLVFNAFNTCDSITYKKFFADDLEFYHDTGGLTIGLNNELKSFKDMCARGTHMKRVLEKNSVEVYPIKNYGAVEIGIHTFYHTNKGEKEQLSGTYKFIHVWKYLNGQWKITRVISYDHSHVNN